MQMKTLIVLPTYNEEKNINQLVQKVLKYDVDLLFIDDNSQDKTVEEIKSWMDKSNRVHLIQRPSKLGLGTAYIEGFKWGLRRDYDIFFEMDSDLSHNPEDIPRFIEKMKEGYDLVIGSRYINGTISVVGWDFKRLLLSKFANWYATTILKLKNLSDVTSGYRCYSRKCLEKLDLSKIKSNGYAFQIEMVYRLVKIGCKITEIPIIFYERNEGSSKMSRKIALEAAIMVWKLKFERII